MLHRLPTIAFATLALACSMPPDVGSTRAPNVYGEDDRHDWHEPNDRLSASENDLFDAIGRETVGMFVRDRHVRLDDPDAVLLCGSNVDDYPAGGDDGCFTRTLAWNVWSSSDFGDDATPLCADERYALQPSIGRCSGTLIAEDLVLTSGHCVDESDDVETSVFVFNWRYESAPGAATYEYRSIGGGRDVAFWIEQPAPGLASIDRDDVYHAVDRYFVYDRADRLRPSGSTTTSTVRDYAIVRLDRPVALPRHPATMDYGLELPGPGTPLVVGGFGKGMPLKFDDGAFAITSWYCDASFNPAILCNLHDGYAGGSGSGVFRRDGTLVAAHRGSATDFEYDATDDCYRSQVVPVPVPSNDFPAAAHHTGWAIDDFCRRGFERDSVLCGDPSYREPGAASCSGGSVHAVGTEVCCQQACTGAGDCALDGWGGGCDVFGFCRREATCFAGERWERDACGRPTHRLPGTMDECVPAGDACEVAETLEAVDQRVSVSLDGMRDRSVSSCGGRFGPDRVWQLDLDEPFDVSIALDGHVVGWVLDVRGPGADCASATELFCGVGDTMMDARFEGRLEAGTYFVTVDTLPSDELRDPYWDSEPALELRFGPVSEPADGGADAGSADAGVPEEMDGGCSCRAARGSSSSPWLLFAALGLVLARRRR